MLADLHCHYAMHLLESVEQPKLRHALRGIRLSDRLRALVMWVANRIANFRKWSSGPRVTLEKLEEAEARLVLSVLSVPFDEMDLGLPYGPRPSPAIPVSSWRRWSAWRTTSARDPAGTRHVVATRAGDLEGGRIAFVHCIEGGFHLGATPDEIDAKVTQLARRGVVYITLAHLFWRRVATNAPALPFSATGGMTGCSPSRPARA